MVEEEPTWAFEYSVDCEVNAAFAWDFWTNVNNWVLDPDVESVEIEGPFGTGTRGFTNSKSSGRIEWRVVESRPGRAVIEFPLSGAVGRFAWTFEAIATGVRITQRCTLQGEQAKAYAKTVCAGVEAGMPAGMNKLCRTMENAARLDHRSASGD